MPRKSKTINPPKPAVGPGSGIDDAEAEARSKAARKRMDRAVPDEFDDGFDDEARANVDQMVVEKAEIGALGIKLDLLEGLAVKYKLDKDGYPVKHVTMTFEVPMGGNAGTMARAAQLSLGLDLDDGKKEIDF